jgi:hypothetical protein
MTKELTISEEVILAKIYVVRGEKVMLDRDLSNLYGVETKVLKQAVRRNMERFPEDFMFQMRKEEFDIWRSQFVTSKSDMKGLRYSPFCFTNLGVPQLSTVLKSKKAIMINLQIMRVFDKMHKMILAQKELFIKMEAIESKLINHDDSIMLLFEYIKQFEETKQQELEQKNRPRIGY